MSVFRQLSFNWQKKDASNNNSSYDSKNCAAGNKGDFETQIMIMMMKRTFVAHPKFFIFFFSFAFQQTFDDTTRHTQTKRWQKQK